MGSWPVFLSVLSPVKWRPWGFPETRVREYIAKLLPCVAPEESASLLLVGDPGS